MTVKANRRAVVASIAAIGVVVIALFSTSWWSRDDSAVVDASTAETASAASSTVDRADADPGSTVNDVPAAIAAALDSDRRGAAGSEADGSAVPFSTDQADVTNDRPSEPGAGSTGQGDQPLGHAAAGPRLVDGDPSDDGTNSRSTVDGAHSPAPSFVQSTRGSRDALNSSPTLRFVYFVEADQEFDPTAPALIESQARALQLFWYEQFGGTFRLANPVVDVVYGGHDAAWYDTTEVGDDPRWFRLTNLRSEVRATLGVEADENIRMITYPAARIDGRVGANRYDGAWMDGDDIACIDGAVATTPYAVEYPANCLTTVAHELGHVYGLGHDGEEDDCMQFGFYQYVLGTERCDFAEPHRRAVIDDPLNVGWLDARPGDQGF